jgi:hypothetical protein
VVLEPSYYRGKWLNNTYILLDKTEWKTKEEFTRGHQSPMDKPEDTGVLLRKHISLSISKSSPEKITDEDLNHIAEMYNVPLPFVRSKYQDLIDYCLSTGKKYQDYLAALRKWVRSDAMKVRKEASYHDRKRAIDASDL